MRIHMIHKAKLVITTICSILAAGCLVDEYQFTGAAGEVRLMTLNPGHFHAALVQKYKLEQVDPAVYVYAPPGPDVDLHLGRIESFNNRTDDPTDWETIWYIGKDYLERMIDNRPGNVVVIAGNNSRKTQYIHRSVSGGLHVLSDKPMAINETEWQRLVSAFEIAKKNKVLIYDIMTERYEITNTLQRLLSREVDLFGELIRGNKDKPAIEMGSVHHLFKYVAGSPLRRPPWYFDVEQQGEGIVDVTTHLVDLSMYNAFPNSAIDYHTDIDMIKARRWTTMISLEQFRKITGIDDFPIYLQHQLREEMLPLYCNGEISYTVRDHHVRLSVEWEYQAPPGGNDTHFSIMRGTRADLVIRQGLEEEYISTLYVEPPGSIAVDDLENSLRRAIDGLQSIYPGITFRPSSNGFRIIIPDEYRLDHEARFGRVAKAFFTYLIDGKLPGWEIPNMITKYYITTQARVIIPQE
jgi:predicted dehydrogenase